MNGNYYTNSQVLTLNRGFETNFKSIIYHIIKRGFDVVASSMGLLVLSPVFLATMVAIRINSKGKAIYTQQRIGLNGKEFKLFKFRSMITNADEVLANILANDPEAAREYEINKKLKNDPRVTKVGKFIRRTSIDELPQLINVLKGDMSLIGNRPYLPREIEDMGPYYYQIIKSKPGITGFWQTSGRSETTFATRCKMEAKYSFNRSLKLDTKIFFKTFSILFKGI